MSLRGAEGDEAISRSFSYDSLSRLTQSASPSTTEQWTFDKVDNWLTKVRRVTPSPLEGEGGGEGDRVTQFIPNTVNAYTTVDGTAYIYDENGNLIDDGVHTYTYNYRNLLTRVVNKADNTEVASYGYDALGRRIFKTVSGEMTRFVYEGVHIIAELAPDDTITHEYIYGNSIDDPVALVIPAEAGIQSVYYYHTDALGSTTALTDSTGAIVEKYTYGPYGEPEIHDGATDALLEASAIGNNHLYTGQIYDAETGFYYYKARFYSPQLGRFLQRDPLGYIDGYNLYAYVNNNPINWIDPLGLEKGTGVWGTAQEQGERIAGTTYGAVQTAYYTIEGIVSASMDPVGTANKIIQSVANYEETGNALLTAVNNTIQSYKTGTPFEQGRIVGRVVSEATLALAGTKGVGNLLKAGRVAIGETQTVFRQGRFANESWGGNFVKGKEWSPNHPLTTPGFAKQHGLPAENTGTPDWIVRGRVEGNFSTRPSLPSYNQPTNTGGKIEIVPNNPAKTRLDWFYMP